MLVRHDFLAEIFSRKSGLMYSTNYLAKTYLNFYLGLKHNSNLLIILLIMSKGFLWISKLCKYIFKNINWSNMLNISCNNSNTYYKTRLTSSNFVAKLQKKSMYDVHCKYIRGRGPIWLFDRHKKCCQFVVFTAVLFRCKKVPRKP